MAKVVKMPLSYFLDENENGNVSLTSISQKVDDASMMLTGDTVIELDNGVQCSTRDELFLAVSQSNNDLSKGQKESTSSPQDMASTNNQNGNGSNGNKIGLVIVLSLVASGILWVIINMNWTSYAYDDSFTGSVAVSGLPYGWGFPVFIGLFAICVVIGLVLVRKRK